MARTGSNSNFPTPPEAKDYPPTPWTTFDAFPPPAMSYEGLAIGESFIESFEKLPRVSWQTLAVLHGIGRKEAMTQLRAARPEGCNPQCSDPMCRFKCRKISDWERKHQVGDNLSNAA